MQDLGYSALVYSLFLGSFYSYHHIKLVRKILSNIIKNILGRGNIKDRLKSPERKNWAVNIVEYSLVKDQADMKKYENFHIQEYKALYNRLSVHNLISGSEVNIRVGWQSGRMRHLGKVVSEQSLQGFESLTYLNIFKIKLIIIFNML